MILTSTDLRGFKMRTLKASSEGLQKIRYARENLTQENGWAVDNEQWLEETTKFLPPVRRAGRSSVPGTVSIGTWKRFLGGKAVKAPSFKAFCLVLNLAWEEVAEIGETQLLEERSALAISQQRYFALPEKLPSVRNWFGRSEEMDTLKAQLLDPETRAITITAVCVVGLAGIGKTTLASQLIRQLHAENAPFASAAWESLRSVTGKPPRFDSTVDSLISTLSRGKITTTETLLDDYFKKTERLVDLLQESPCLLVLDNVETVLKAKQASRAGYFADDCAEYAWLFQQLAETSHRSKVILTSREVIATFQQSEARVLRLGGLQQEAAIALLKSFQLLATSDELACLSDRYEGHPKALEIVAAVIQEDFQGNVSDFLQDRKWLLLRDIESIIDEVFNRLSQEEYACLRQISIYQTAEYALQYEGIAAQMPTFSKRDLKENIILALRRRQVLDFNNEDKSFQMHPLVQEKASYLLDSESNRLAHAQAFQYFFSITKPPREWREFDDVKPLLRAYYHACQAKEWDEAARAIGEAYDFLRQGSHFDLIIDLYSELIPSGWETGEQLVQSSLIHIDILSNLGYAYYFIRNHEIASAYLEQALAISRSMGDGEREARALCYLGRHALENPSVAREYLQQSLSLLTNTEDGVLKNLALSTLGEVYFSLGDQQTAAQLFEQCLTLSRQIKFEQGEASALGNLGNVYTELGEHELSLDYRRQYLEAVLKINNVKSKEFALNAVSVGFNNVGDYQSALRHAEECVKLTRETRDRAIEALAIRNMGVAYRGLGDYPNALNAFNKCLNIARSISDKRSEANSLYELGVTHKELEQLSEAIKYLKSSLTIFIDINHYGRELMVLIELIEISMRHTSEKEDLHTYIHRAEEICVEFQLPSLSKVQQLKLDIAL
jgi:tetratricopeptide (TPR) repeat protein